MTTYKQGDVLLKFTLETQNRPGAQALTCFRLLFVWWLSSPERSS